MDFTAANVMPEAEGFSDNAADFLGSAAGDVLNAYRLGIGSGATALGKSILEKTGGSLLGKAVAAGADNALLNLPQNVVNGLAKSEDPADAVKNIGTSELMDFTAGGLLGGVSSTLLKPVKVLGEAADDSAIDAILKNATKVDQTANTVYNESIGKELPDALGFGNVMEGALEGSDAGKLVEKLLPETETKVENSAVDELWGDVSDNIKNVKASGLALDKETGAYDEFNLIKEPAERYTYLIDKSNEMDVGSEKNCAVFYAGSFNSANGIKYARSVAENYIDELFARTGIRKTTLERTPGGKWMDELSLYDKMPSGKTKYEELGLTNEQVNQIWNNLSKRFADNASGSVTAFSKNVPNIIKSKKIFYNTELPKLIENKKKGIVTHINIR